MSEFQGPQIRALRSTDDDRAADHRLDEALDALDSTAVPLGIRIIKDGPVRESYRRSIRAAIEELRNEVEQGKITPRQGAERANLIRNEIMEIMRGRSTDLGRSVAEKMKKQGRTLEELIEKYSQRLFGKAPEALTDGECSSVMREIIAAAARDKPMVTSLLRVLGNASRGLIALTIGLAVYDIYTSSDRVLETEHQAVLAGAGVAGSYVVAALGASLVCGPGAPFCLGVCIVVGGISFALGADYFWKRLQPRDGHR